MDDVAAAAGDHGRGNGSRNQEDALQVSVKDALPVVFGFFVNGAKAGAANAGVVDEDRDGAEFRFGGLHERCDVTGAGYVEGLTADFRAGRRQLRGGFFEHLRVASAKTDGCTELCELRGNGFADAAAAAGYERDVTREILTGGASI